MSVTVEFSSPGEEAAVKAQAKAEGLSVGEWLRELARRHARASTEAGAGGVMWSQCPAVESRPGKLGGAWVLKGTRMPVSAIFESLEAGASLDDILSWYDGLDRDQVKAVIEFAARSLDASRAAAP